MIKTNEAQKADTNSNKAIELAAYFLWEKGGCQSGRDVDYWLQAEKELHAVSPSRTRPEKDASSLELTRRTARP